jgi:integrating conjugative element protein (TIGR03759 family)
MKPHALLLLAVFSGTPFQASADQQTQSNPQTSIGITQHEQSTLEYSERSRAQQWDLTKTEWQRYKTLMQGIRGSISPATISPIEVLGIHAESEADRRKYAERWAQILRDDTEQILAFQRAVIEANVHLYADQPLIDTSMLKRQPQKAALEPGDRLLFFTATDCNTCDAQLSLLLSKTGLSAIGLDIFLLGTEGRDEAVRQWAQARQIPPEQVHRQTITLNHDSGTLARLSQGIGKPPYLMRKSVLGTAPITMSELW